MERKGHLSSSDRPHGQDADDIGTVRRFNDLLRGNIHGYEESIEVDLVRFHVLRILEGGCPVCADECWRERVDSDTKSLWLRSALEKGYRRVQYISQ